MGEMREETLTIDPTSYEALMQDIDSIPDPDENIITISAAKELMQVAYALGRRDATPEPYNNDIDNYVVTADGGDDIRIGSTVLIDGDALLVVCGIGRHPQTGEAAIFTVAPHGDDTIYCDNLRDCVVADGIAE